MPGRHKLRLEPKHHSDDVGYTFAGIGNPNKKFVHVNPTLYNSEISLE
jgi:hypothetical protein